MKMKVLYIDGEEIVTLDIIHIPRIGEGLTIFVEEHEDYRTFVVKEVFYSYDEEGLLCHDEVVVYVELLSETTYSITNLNRVEQLEYRIALINDDIQLLKKHIDTDGMDIDAITAINNIEIACNLEDQESLDWTLYPKQNS
jgi:hypothetical protein